jgi:hypothetical protein
MIELGKNSLSFAMLAFHQVPLVSIMVCDCDVGAFPVSNIVNPASTRSIAVLFATGTFLYLVFTQVLIPLRTRIVAASARKS